MLCLAGARLHLKGYVYILQADLVIFPFVDRFALCAPKHAGYNVSAAWDGAIGDWLDAMSARPSCKVSCANL